MGPRADDEFERADAPSAPPQPGSADWRSALAEIGGTARRIGWRAVLGLVGVVVVLVVVAFLLGVRSGSPSPIDLPRTGTATPGAPPTTQPRVLVVHIDGEVAQPGLYEIASSARVADVIELAGGMTADADTTRINLARKLADAERIIVPTKGQPLPAGVAGAGSDGDVGGLVNVNTAGAARLAGLNGVGPALAARIVEYREAYGPFATLDALTAVSGIGPKTVDGLRSQAQT